MNKRVKHVTERELADRATELVAMLITAMEDHLDIVVQETEDQDAPFQLLVHDPRTCPHEQTIPFHNPFDALLHGLALIGQQLDDYHRRIVKAPPAPEGRRRSVPSA